MMEETGNLAFISDNRYPIWTAEEHGLWAIVKKNPLDYCTWMSLINVVEKAYELDLSKIRQVYRAFLWKFPLSVEQWKNLADHEASVDSSVAMQVYEDAIPIYSVKLWYHYCQFAISIGKDSHFIRSLFERGLEHVGTDYHSNLLWDSYIKYEEKHSAWNKVADIYTRLLGHPIQDLDLFFNRFKEFAETKSLAEILRGHDQGPNVFDKGFSFNISEYENSAKYIFARQMLYNKAKEYETKIVIFE